MNWLNKLDLWITEWCLDLYDWYTSQIARFEQEIIDYKKLMERSK